MTTKYQYRVVVAGVDFGSHIDYGCQFTEEVFVLAAGSYEAIGKALQQIASTRPQAVVSLSGIEATEVVRNTQPFGLGRLNWSSCNRAVTIR